MNEILISDFPGIPSEIIYFLNLNSEIIINIADQMNHEKVVILPLNHPEQANAMLEELIFNQAYALYIVFGNDKRAINTVELASKVAGTVSDPKMVVWINDRNVELEVLSKLKDDKEKLKKCGEVFVIMLSIMDEVVDVICTNEAEPDLLRIFESFELAF